MATKNYKKRPYRGKRSAATKETMAEKFAKDKLTKNESKDKIALRLHGGVFTTDGLKGKLSNILKNN